MNATCATTVSSEALAFRAGPEIGVIGDGYCWEWALGASLGLLRCPQRPTEVDYEWARTLLLGAQAHVTAGNLSLELHERLQVRNESRPDSEEVRKFMAIEPVYEGKDFSEDNYSGARSAYPIMASYLQIPILCIMDQHVLDEDFFCLRGKKNLPARPDTTLGEFSLYRPEEEYEQNLSLVGVQQLLLEGDQHMVIVVHNGVSGAGGHWTAFAARKVEGADRKEEGKEEEQSGVRASDSKAEAASSLGIGRRLPMGANSPLGRSSPRLGRTGPLVPRSCTSAFHASGLDEQEEYQKSFTKNKEIVQERERRARAKASSSRASDSKATRPQTAHELLAGLYRLSDRVSCYCYRYHYYSHSHTHSHSHHHQYTT